MRITVLYYTKDGRREPVRNAFYLVASSDKKNNVEADKDF